MFGSISSSLFVDALLLTQAIGQSVAANLDDVARSRPIKAALDCPGGDLIQRDGVGTHLIG